MALYECMICGAREHVLREGGLCLCTRCVEALGLALAGKLWEGPSSDGGDSSPLRASE